MVDGVNGLHGQHVDKIVKKQDQGFVIIQHQPMVEVSVLEKIQKRCHVLMETVFEIQLLSPAPKLWMLVAGM